MRKPVFLIGTNAIILVVVFLLLAQSLVVGQRVLRLSASVGKVEIQRAGQSDYVTLVNRDILTPGDTVKTGPASDAEFAWSDGSRWKLMAGSEMKVEASNFNALHTSEQTSLQLKSGRLMVRVPKVIGTGSSFRVTTPHLVATVKGTVFAVHVSHCGTSVDVYRGKVEIGSPAGSSSPQAPILVEAGRQYKSSRYGDKPPITNLNPATFANQESLTLPQATYSVVGSDKGPLLQVAAEAGDKVKVDGKDATETSTGRWQAPVTMVAGVNKWKVVVTDIHGDSAEIPATFEYKIPPAEPAAKPAKSATH